MPTLADVLYLLAWNGYEDQAYKASMTCKEAWEDDRILFPHIINKKFGEQEKSLIGCLTYRDYSGRSIPRVERLIGLGADPDVPSGTYQLTPFADICIFDDDVHMDLFKFFLTRANIHGQGGWTPIANQSLATNCSLKQQLLLDHGADIHRITDGESVLYKVCSFMVKKDLSAIKFLLDHGADPTIECTGETPLEVCLVRGRVDIAKLLMEYGATIPDSDDCVAAAYYTDEENVLKFLVANGKSIDPQLLVRAVHDVNVKGVRMLLACGVCPNTVVEGKPIIFRIDGVTAEKAEIVKLLCAAGLNVHAKAVIEVYSVQIPYYLQEVHTFLYQMVYEYIITKNEHTFTVIKTLIARGAKPPPLKMYNTMPAFKKNPTQYTHMNILFMKARWAAKTAKV
jgi:hypothetical protein